MLMTEGQHEEEQVRNMRVNLGEIRRHEAGNRKR